TAAAELARALGRDEDEEVRRWCALGLARAGGAVSPLVESLARSGDRAWRRRAALALAERGDARGADDLAAWWAEEAPPRAGLDLERAKELLAAMAKIKDRAAVPALVRSLADLRARPFVADALGAIGDLTARAPLLEALRGERYVTSRPHEARALVKL